MKTLIYLILILPSLISALTVEEKVGQVFLAPVYERELSEKGRAFLARTHLGNVIYFGFANGPFTKEQISQLSRDLKEAIELPPLIAIDQEGGGFNQLKFIHYPHSNREMEAEVAYAYGESTGKELKNAGITTDLAPVVDVVGKPGSPLHYRSFGDEPEKVIGKAKKMIAGLHASGIHAVLKHFPGLGDTSVDSHLGLPVLNKTYEEMETCELMPYFALKGEADAVMVGHLLVPKVDPERPASLSPVFITAILRGKIGFDKVVISDSLVMKGVLGEVYTFDEAVARITQTAIEAFLAGCDLLILGGLQWVNFEVTEEQNEKMIEYVMKGFAAAVRSGTIPEERLDQSVQRVLHMKLDPL